MNSIATTIAGGVFSAVLASLIIAACKRVNRTPMRRIVTGFLSLGLIGVCWYFSIMAAIAMGIQGSNDWAVAFTIAWLIDTIVSGLVTVLVRLGMYFKLVNGNRDADYSQGGLIMFWIMTPEMKQLVNGAV